MGLNLKNKFSEIWQWLYLHKASFKKAYLKAVCEYLRFERQIELQPVKMEAFYSIPRLSLMYFKINLNGEFYTKIASTPKSGLCFTV